MTRARSFGLQSFQISKYSNFYIAFIIIIIIIQKKTHTEKIYFNYPVFFCRLLPYSVLKFEMNSYYFINPIYMRNLKQY